MTLASSIIVDAFREANIVPISGSPSTAEQAEALRRLNAIVIGCVGTAAGTELSDLNIGGTDDQSSSIATGVPENVRLVLNLSAALSITLPSQPYEGQRFAIVDAAGNLATYNLTIDPNGRKIEGQSTLTLTTASMARQWLYRADTANWVKVDSLASADEMPLPTEFDDYFITRLAIRLNPRNSTATAQETMLALEEAERRLRARYRKRRPLQDMGTLGLFGSTRGSSDNGAFREGLMTLIPLGKTDYKRTIAKTPPVQLVNRYFEADPTNGADQVALLSRPALRKWLEVGTGPIRAVYSQPGALDDSLFVVSGTKLYEIETDETITEIGTVSGTSSVSMAATDYPYKLFVANGTSLQVYVKDGAAGGTLTATAIAANDTIEIGGVYYKWVVIVADGTGGSGTPYQVLLGGNTATSLENMAAAINNSGAAGTDYSLSVAANEDVTASSTTTTLSIHSRTAGTGGNSVTTTETGAGIAWGAGTLSGGGSTSFSTVAVPDNDGIISVGFIAQFVICVVAQGYDKNGRFYWIRPGEITIDELDFATAERSPDPVWAVVIVGDQAWFPGSSTNEVWYASGDGDAPFVRQQGRLFDKGVWEGTILQVKDDVMAVGTDGTVYRIGAEMQIVSTPGIAQRLREAINEARA